MDLFKAIQNDIDEYLWLCEKFNEKAEADESGINPYGEHARKLKNKENPKEL